MSITRYKEGDEITIGGVRFKVLRIRRGWVEIGPVDGRKPEEDRPVLAKPAEKP